MQSDWQHALEELPSRMPPTAWTGHIPFLFLLFKLAKPRTFVELGVFLGGSFLAACDAAQRFNTETHCYGVDTWEGDPHSGFLSHTDEMFRAVQGVVATYRNCELIRATFDDALARFPERSVDLLHIDGLHTYEAVSHDLNAWTPKLSGSAIVMLHDTVVRERGFGVWRLWNELKGRHRHLEFAHSYGLGVALIGVSGPPAFDELLQAYERDRLFAKRFQRACKKAGATLPTRVVERHRRQRHISPAEPCPCGSGELYQNCHARQGRS